MRYKPKLTETGCKLLKPLYYKEKNYLLINKQLKWRYSDSLLLSDIFLKLLVDTMNVVIRVFN